jgi:hypothetical protein
MNLFHDLIFLFFSFWNAGYGIRDAFYKSVWVFVFIFQQEYQIVFWMGAFGSVHEEIFFLLFCHQMCYSENLAATPPKSTNIITSVSPYDDNAFLHFLSSLNA